MATTLLILMMAFISFIITPWIGSLNHHTLHTTDLRAGDEGE